MGRTKKVIESKADEAMQKETKSKATKAVVMKNGTEAHAPYTLEMNGEGFIELAKEFAGKVGGEIITE